MKSLQTALWVLLVVATASTAFGQPVNAGIRYIHAGADISNDSLCCPCDFTTGIEFVDGTVISLFWDNNANGPDAADVQPEIGTGYAQVNWNSTTFNGQARGYGAGYFNATTNLIIQQLPRSTPEHPNDVPKYYLQINSGGCCLICSTFTVVTGPQTISLKQQQWMCQDVACGSSGTPPAPPTGFVASDDAGCLEVAVSWVHDGLNVAGFNVYRTDTSHLVGAYTRLIRSANLAVDNELPAQYFVRAFNSLGSTSLSSNSDEGRTYLLRFISGAGGDVIGLHAAGSSVTLFMERPVVDCPSSFKIFLLQAPTDNGPWTRYSENGGVPLAQDSLNTQITVQLPVDTVYHCRILLEDSSNDRGVILHDTTTSVFALGMIDAVPDENPLLPDHFALMQNYPNPFNPETEIAFMVPVSAPVRITVYNMLGQEVRTLANDIYTTGMHHLRWDGRSNSGVTMGAGVYFYRMEAPGYAQTMKMLMLK